MLSFLQRYSISLWPIAVIAVLLVLLIFNPWLNPLLRYDEGAILKGEYWRLLTAHFIHLGWVHGLLNIAGFLLLAWIYPAGRAAYWWLFYLVSSILISVYIVFDGGTFYYVGASGVLHGLFILSAYFSRSLELWRRYALMTIVTAKLYWEQSRFYHDAGLGDAIGGHVYIDAHLIGGLCGLLVVIIFLCKNRLKFPSYD